MPNHIDNLTFYVRHMWELRFHIVLTTYDLIKPRMAIRMVKAAGAVGSQEQAGCRSAWAGSSNYCNHDPTVLQDDPNHGPSNRIWW